MFRNVEVVENQAPPSTTYAHTDTCRKGSLMATTPRRKTTPHIRFYLFDLVMRRYPGTTNNGCVLNDMGLELNWIDILTLVHDKRISEESSMSNVDSVLPIACRDHD